MEKLMGSGSAPLLQLQLLPAFALLLSCITAALSAPVAVSGSDDDRSML
jgi:hypothetical protein